MADWTFVTNHALVLASIAKKHDQTARDVGVTERTAHKIILDLEKDGYITKTKAGVKNRYRVYPGLPIKTADGAVGELLELLGWKRNTRSKPRINRKNHNAPEKLTLT